MEVSIDAARDVRLDRSSKVGALAGDRTRRRAKKWCAGTRHGMA
jgi:hypothetical protein